MFLNEEEQSKLSISKSSFCHKKKKRKKGAKNYSNYYKYCKYSKGVNKEEKISLTEHSIILNEYQEELKFLGLKRENEINNTNDNIVICVKNKTPHKQKFRKGLSKSKGKKTNKITEEERVIKMSHLFNLYHYLFIKSGLVCSKPCRFVDYLSNEIYSNEYNSSNKDDYLKITFENIKKLIYNLSDEEPENVLINRIIKEYFHCNFENSIIEKFIKKINQILIEENPNLESKNIDNLNAFIENNSISINNDTYDKNSKSKKDKFSYSNLLLEKLKNNNYQSCLSMTNDLDYFKSIIYINNKCSKNINKAQPLEKDILNALEENKNLINSFKEENKQKAEQENNFYLNKILKNRKLKNYINKKLSIFNNRLGNNIFKLLDKKNLKKIICLLKNSKKDLENKLEKINEIIAPEKISKDDLSFFKILIFFIGGLTLMKNFPNEIAKNDLALLNSLYQYFNKKTTSKIKNRSNLKSIKVKENNNKIKTENIYQNSTNENSISLVEERKIEERENNKIIKIILNDNDIPLNYENKETTKHNEGNINKLFSNLSSISKNEKKPEIQINNTKYLDKNINKNLLIYNDIYQKNQSKENKKLNNFEQRILNEISLGNDIFKLNYIKLREKKSKIKEIDEAIYEKKINIEIKEEITKLNELKDINNNNNENNNNVFKEGNKIIIFAD